MRKPKYFWVMVSRDDVELPLIVEESSDKLAERLGIDARGIRRMALMYERGELKTSKYIRVPRDEND